jgi:hypothetical protein
MGLNQSLQLSSRCLIVEKFRLGPQNGLRSLGPEKLLNIISCQKLVLS